MCSSSASGGLIFVAALVGAVAYGDGFDLHLVYSPAATDGAGHGGADIDDAAAVEGAAVAHAHVATLAGLETGDAHHTGQGQGAVCRVFAALGQALAHGTDGAAIVVHRGLTRFAVLQGCGNIHRAVAFAVYGIRSSFEFRLGAGIIFRRIMRTFAPRTSSAAQHDAAGQYKQYSMGKRSHARMLS